MRALVASVTIMLVAPTVALSQTIRGRVLDSESDLPIAGARVVLLGATGGPSGAVSADDDGGFEIQAGAAGTFRLRVERIGYPQSTSPEIVLAASEVVEVTFRLDPQAILLAPLTVEARRGADLGRQQFTRRCEFGEGICLDPIHIALAEPSFPTDLFRTVPTLIVDMMNGGLVRRITGGGCLMTFLNNEPKPIMSSVPRRMSTVGVISGANPRRSGRSFSMGSTMWDNALDRRVPATAIRGVEIYLNPEDVPREIMDGPRGWELWPGGYLGRCGAIVVWTNDQW